MEQPALITTDPGAGAGTTPRWLPFVRLPRSVSRAANVAARLATPLVTGWRWAPAAILLGTLPLALSLLLGVRGHQALTGVTLALFALACAREGRRWRGLALITLVFATHCFAAIFASLHWPARAAAVLPDGEDYWQRQLIWIQTGQDPEYDPANWVEAHARTFVGAAGSSYLSFGAIPFVAGFHQVDLMNYYNGRLVHGSQNGLLALVAGWHVWSLCRGVGYVLLTFEMLAWSLERLTGSSTLSAGRARVVAAGVVFLLLDMLAKWTLMPGVCETLRGNLVVP